MFQVTATLESISVYWRGDSYLERGVAEATDMDGYWYVNRVLVQPGACRGRGIGGELLERLKKAVAEQGSTRLVVTPGGYVESPKQKKFYKKHEFVEEEPGLLAWYSPTA